MVYSNKIRQYPKQTMYIKKLVRLWDCLQL